MKLHSGALGRSYHVFHYRLLCKKKNHHRQYLELLTDIRKANQQFLCVQLLATLAYILFINVRHTQPAITCSNLTLETLEQCVKYVQN